MAQNSYSIYFNNDGAGNYIPIVKRGPATVPAGGLNTDVLPLADFPVADAINVTAATNATPVVVTTAAAHGLVTGDAVWIRNGKGNTAVNGTHTITVVSTTTFQLDNSVGNGTYTNDGSASNPYATMQKVPRSNNLPEILKHACAAIEFDKSGGA